MANISIHPNPNLGGTNAAYSAADLAALGRSGRDFFQRAANMFTFVTNSSVRTGEGGAPANDYAVVAAALGITEAQAASVWTFLNGMLNVNSMANAKDIANTIW